MIVMRDPTSFSPGAPFSTHWTREISFDTADGLS
jgi:hypothetical protein